MAMKKVRVLVWGEFRHEKMNPVVAGLYPGGMHETIATTLRRDDRLQVTAVHLDMPEHGVTEALLAETDVIVWWGHLAHGDVADDVVNRVVLAIHEGMGAVFLHSAHFSKPFKRLMGTGCDLKWREAQDSETLWVTRPGHPLVAGITDHITLEREEMYGEFFDIPEPEQTVMISSFSGGEVFRSLCTWTRGAGRIVYFRPGHETHPTYHNEQVLRVIQNACHYAASERRSPVRYGRADVGWMEQK